MADEDSGDLQLPKDGDDSNFVTQTEASPRHLVASSGASSDPMNSSLSTASPQLPPVYSKETMPHGIGSGGDTIRRALLRSSRGRRDVKVDNVFSLHKQPDEVKRGDESQDDARNSDTAENDEAVLLGYDAQWCWVESQDDVTFL